MKELLSKKQKGITLIALVITIIVLLILAGVALSAITGNESAINKATQARTENDQGAARDAASLMATGYIQEYMTNKYSQGSSDLESAAETTGHYVARKMNNKTSGEFTFTTSGSALTVSKGGNTIVTGTIEDNGTITWGTTGNGGDNGGSGNEQQNNNNQGGNETPTSNLSAAEQAALTTNGMEERTAAQINADTSLTEDQQEALTDTSKIKAVLTGNVPVPVGYDYVEGTSTAVGTKPQNGSWGVVIKDSNNNEWVWVPVNSTESVAPTALYTTDAEGYPMTADKDNKWELAKVYGLKLASINGLDELKIASTSSSSNSVDAKSTKRSASEIIPGITRGNDYREPALVTDYDLQEEYYSQAGDFASAEEFATAMSDDYNSMITSITNYGGFYVGRYELSGTNNGSDQAITNAKVQRNQAPMDAVNWYRLYQACRSFGTTTATSTMIFGTQWDVMCLWAWSKERSTTGYYTFHSDAHSEDCNAQTGTNPKDIKNNIYDIEGSRWEWTQEAFTSCGRVIRGGDYTNASHDYACCHIGGAYPPLHNFGSRPILYIM